MRVAMAMVFISLVASTRVGLGRTKKCTEVRMTKSRSTLVSRMRIQIKIKTLVASSPYYISVLCWLQATNFCKESLLSTGYNFQFIMKIIFAMIILKKVEDRFPTGPVWVGGAFILIAIVSSVIQVNWKGGSSMDDDEGVVEGEEEEYQMLDGDVVDE